MPVPPATASPAALPVFDGGIGNGFIHRFRNLARSNPDRVFAQFDGTPITFGGLDRQSDSVAAGLRRLGVAAGARVAVMMQNSAAVLALLFGIAKASAVWIPINIQLRGEGLRYVLEHGDPSLMVADTAHFDAIRGLGTKLQENRLVAFGDAAPYQLETTLASDPVFDEGAPPPQAPYAIMYTSGTTGPPKGVVVTHRMLGLAGEAARRVSAVGDGDTMLVWEPLYHIGGAQLIVIPTLVDVSLAMLTRFSASRFWEQAIASGATHIHYLGGILQILLKQPAGRLDQAHKVRVAWGGGCPRETWVPFQERFGVRIRECYGMTETSSIATINGSGLVGSVGQSVPWFDVRIVDRADAPLPAGARGEIVVSELMQGGLLTSYFSNPEATARALRGGAFHTGDLGSIDGAGNLFFHGRLTDNARVRGENVSAWEVESVAGRHPDIEDCAMIGVAADVGEQDIKLFVQPRAGATIAPEALSRWLGERLAPYQNPRYIAVVAGFERTPSQRIMKHRLSIRRDEGWDRLSLPKKPTR